MRVTKNYKRLWLVIEFTCLIVITSYGTYLLAIEPCKESPLIIKQDQRWPIPEYFETYTKEGLFKISYPDDWSHDQSVTDEQWSEFKDAATKSDEEWDFEGIYLAFFAGKPGEDGFNPNVNITFTASYNLSLDEIIEEINLENEVNPSPGYSELARYETWIDGRRAMIRITEETMSPFAAGSWRHLSMVTVKGEFMWYMVCITKSEDYSLYESAFQSIVRSFRILY